MALLGNILGIVTGIIIIIKSIDNILLIGIDIVVINCIVLLCGLMLLKKSKGAGWL